MDARRSLLPTLVALLAASTSAASADPVGVVSVASLDEPVDIGGTWRLHLGDGAFATAELDDAAWEPLQVPGGLGAQGHPDFTGVYWLRVRVLVPRTDRELSLRFGPIDSAYELYIDGAKVGGLGRVDPPQEDCHDRHAVWPVPLAASSDGVVVIAIRGWRSPLRQDASPGRGAFTAGPNLIGTTAEIVRAQYLRDIDKLISGVTVLVVALYHLQLFRRRREEIHYLWFGLFSLFMSSYLLSSAEASFAFLGTLLHAKTLWTSLILTLPCFLQFLWPFLGHPIRWWWRANQALMVVYAVINIAWPTQWFVIKFIVWFELGLLLPLMIGTTVVVMRAAWRGNKEARTLLLGTLGLVLAAADNIILERTTLPVPQIMSYAMAIFVFSIAVSLGNRFARVFRDVDEKNVALRALNAQVQAQVKERSEELSKALTRLGAARRQSAADAGPVAIGSTLDDRFTIERALGAGGMGAVYAGRDKVTGAAVAIKVIQPSSATELDALQRFLREARAVVAVEHPAIVRMLHVDISSDGLFYQAQELVDGVTLEDRLKRGVIAAPLVARSGALLADALAAAHAKSVIHRDVKPANIMLTTSAPGLKLLDFGVAKMTDAPADEHTGTGRHIGTPAYMAPEQRFISSTGDTDHAVTDRVDVYALGVVLHRMVAGGLPGRVLDVVAPQPLLDVVNECLREDPRQRPSAASLATRLATLATSLGAPATLTMAAFDVPGEPTPSGGGITNLLRDLVRTP